MKSFGTDHGLNEEEKTLLMLKEPLFEQEKEEEKEEDPSSKVLFSTNPMDSKACRLQGNPICIVSTNIPSTMGGRANPWANAGESVAISNPYRTKENHIPKFEPQSFSDGKLEFNAIYKVLSLVMGISHKVAQDSGPLLLEFKDFVSQILIFSIDLINGVQKNRDLVTYMNIDGEYFKVKNPSKISVHLATEAIPNGKIRILTRNK